jgi:hypothetical protein
MPPLPEVLSQPRIIKAEDLPRETVLALLKGPPYRPQAFSKRIAVMPAVRHQRASVSLCLIARARLHPVQRLPTTSPPFQTSDHVHEEFEGCPMKKYIQGTMIISNSR